MSKWTKFYDLCSGGSQKTEWPLIVVGGPEAEAIELFKKRFSRDPENVTCHCCGGDYSISEAESLEEVKSWGYSLDDALIIQKEGAAR